jgi:Fic family protein
MSLFDHALWMLLGEARSKCEHIAGAPLAPEQAKELYLLYLSKGALATTAIEGNTLTEAEAWAHLQGKLELPPSRQYLAQELDNIVTACNYMVDELSTQGVQPLTVDRLAWMNAGVLKDLELSPGIMPGEIRRHPSHVGGVYRCPPPEECPYLLSRLCDFLNGFEMPESDRMVFSLIKAIFAHLYLVWIHPFGDGNGRTARLLEFYLLLAAGFPQPTAQLLSNHYNLTRTEYYRRLDEAREPKYGVVNFIRYAVRGFIDGLKEQLDSIRQTQRDVAWVNYVHQKFRRKNTASDVRRRDLVLRLSKRDGFVPRDELRSMSPELADAYAGKTQRTMSRDLNILKDMELIERKRGAVRARREVILAFLPWRHDQGSPESQ